MQGRTVTSGEDRISILPESLLCHILSFLTTNDSVKTSVLSSTWRHLWQWIPRLDLYTSDFPNDFACVSFVHKFMNFRGRSCLRRFKLSIDHDIFEDSTYETCLAIVAMCKLKRFEIKDYVGFCSLGVPLTLSMSDTLVSLKLTFVTLNDFESCSLPCLKIMHLDNVTFPIDEAAEALISCSPVLEELKLSRRPYDNVLVLRVRSKSLKRLTLKRAYAIDDVEDEKYRVVIDAPRLEYLNLRDYNYNFFKIDSMSESVKVYIDFLFEGIGGPFSERNIICNFLNLVSNVRDLTISRRTLGFIYHCLEMNPRFKFHDLARLCATMFSNSSSEMLPVLLETCPNLKHLTLELVHDSLLPEGSSGLLTSLPRCLVTSLESVHIISPITEKATELELVRYFLEKSTTLQKITLCLNRSCGEKHEQRLLKQLFEFPRRSMKWFERILKRKLTKS